MITKVRCNHFGQYLIFLLFVNPVSYNKDVSKNELPSCLFGNSKQLGLFFSGSHRYSHIHIWEVNCFEYRPYQGKVFRFKMGGLDWRDSDVRTK